MTSPGGEMLESVAGLEGVRLAVIGDVMVDVWLEGPVRRVSPEAPVPVVELTATRRRLGGAANVAAVIGSLGGSASVLGLVGDDGEVIEQRFLTQVVEIVDLDFHGEGPRW